MVDEPLTLVVNEVFGPTVQGEGPSSGRRASFIRLGGCNLHCDWCDSKQTWDASRFDLRAEMTRRPVDQVVDEVLAHDTSLIVITGGEPLLHQHQAGWNELLRRLAYVEGRDIEIETNGTQAPTPYTAHMVSRFNVSPKLKSAGDPEKLRLVPKSIAALIQTEQAVFKFVCDGVDAVIETSVVTAKLGIPPHLIWVMPEGTDAVTLDLRLGEIADTAIAAGFNLTTRLHIHAWGNERGR